MVKHNLKMGLKGYKSMEDKHYDPLKAKEKTGLFF